MTKLQKRLTKIFRDYDKDRLAFDPRYAKCIESTYDADLFYLNKMLADRLPKDDEDGLASKRLDDAINNTWYDGITMENWYVLAAQRAGIWSVPK